MNQSAVIKALQDMGFTREQIIVRDTPQQLEGYQGDKRAQTAEIILPRRAVGGSSNDIGFKLQEDGTYEAIISDYDKTSGAANKNKHHTARGYNDNWLKKLNQRYALHQISEQAELSGLFVESVEERNGEIFIECGLFGGV